MTLQETDGKRIAAVERIYPAKEAGTLATQYDVMGWAYGDPNDVPAVASRIVSMRFPLLDIEPAESEASAWFVPNEITVDLYEIGELMQLHGDSGSELVARVTTSRYIGTARFRTSVHESTPLRILK